MTLYHARAAADPALRLESRYELAGTRETQILALLTERRREKLTASAVATVFGTGVERAHDVAAHAQAPCDRHGQPDPELQGG